MLIIGAIGVAVVAARRVLRAADRRQEAEGKRGVFVAIARGAALFIGGFTLINMIGELFVGGFDANLWWIDTRPLPTVVASPRLWAAALLMLAFALRPAMGSIRRRTSLAVIGVTATIVASNVAVFIKLVADGSIVAGFPLPFSAMVMVGLVMMLVAVLLAGAPQPTPGVSAGDTPTPTTAAPDDPAGLTDTHANTATRRPRWKRRAAMAGATAACAVAFPVMQMMCFGYTDYRRPADAIVVFGARAYADGEPSHALADRVRTACTLYHAGVADRLVFSGGPGDGDVHETEAMRRYAERRGVPEHAILCDTQGLNTRATVTHTVPMFQRRHIHRVIAVSHFYHLPRVKLTYQRAGVEVYTVPAKEAYVLKQLPYNMAREVVALWWYHASALLG